MKKTLIFAAFMLSTLAWAGAQQPASGGMQPQSGPQSGAQSSSPNSGMPSSGAQSTTPGGAPDQTGPQATPQAGGAGSSAAGGTITEGCLGGSSPNFTLTATGGKTYKLTLPPNADGSKLTPHVGESIAVMGDVSSDSISVSKVGKGNGTCPAK